MLSIGKLGQGQEQYYLEGVAEGAEDYYVYAGEAPGRWAGGGSASLELTGEVGGDVFTAVLRAVDPRTGQPLGQRNAASKVPGFDLTFSAPKSVSLLFALGDDVLSQRMRDAHDAAVADALGYLERTAAHGRRGHAGAERIRTSGFVAAVFRHRTSRAGDPNLHSHCVIANRVLGADGRWSALDAKAIYAQAKTAGTLYEASLRNELRDLGFSWTVASTGLAEIDGIPHDVRRAFSRRRQQIEQHLAEHGLSSAKAAQVATLETREKKDHTVDTDTLAAQWRARAAELGFTPSVIEDLLRVGRERVQHGRVEEVDVAARLLSPVGLTERSSSFGQREVLRAVANALPDGASVAEVERLAASLLESPEVVPLSPGELRLRGQDVLRVRRPGPHPRLVPFGASEQRFSTHELLALEQELVTTSVAGRGASPVRATVEALDQALASRPSLNAEQRRMVKHIASGGDRVDVVNAAAGSGKTTALDAVAEAFNASARPVLGACLSAKAAGVLRDETGMPTFTITRLLLDLSDPRSGGLPRGGVLVVDEAGQVGTRALAEIEHHVRQADGKLVLVGDLRQLPEIDAGGAFRGLVNRLDAVEMTANHRQREAGECARLRELRSGDVAAAMASYDEAGRITRAASSDELRELLVGDWSQAYLGAADEGSVVMLGLTNHDVDDLNERARDQLVAAGRLGPDEVVVANRGYRIGDHVVTRHNDYGLGVLNGQRWTVRETDVGSRQLLLVGVGHDAVVRLPFAYAEVGQGRLQHAYALTTSLAQGSTVERAFVLGSDATYREAGYTAASRARERTQFYVVSRDQDEGCVESHGPVQVRADDHDPLREMTLALQRSGAQHLALDTGSAFEPRYVDFDSAAADIAARDQRREELWRELASGPADPAGALERVSRQLREAERELAQAREDRTRAEQSAAPRGWLRSRVALREAEPAAAFVEREDLWAKRVEQLGHDQARLLADASRYASWRQQHARQVEELQALDREVASSRAVEHVPQDRFDELAAG